MHADIDCCCGCDSDENMIACPPYGQGKTFDDTLTGHPKPATWPWVKLPVGAQVRQFIRLASFNDIVPFIYACILFESEYNHRKYHTAQEDGANERLDAPIYTWILSDGHTGSTALAGLIATSPHVSTLCASGVANCEGEKILMHMPEHMAPLSNKHRNLMKVGGEYDMNWFRVIREYRR